VCAGSSLSRLQALGRQGTPLARQLRARQVEIAMWIDIHALWPVLVVAGITLILYNYYDHEGPPSGFVMAVVVIVWLGSILYLIMSML
jgi:hypothetical protein